MAQWTFEDLSKTKAFTNECKRIGWSIENMVALYKIFAQPPNQNDIEQFARRIGKPATIVWSTAKRFGFTGGAGYDRGRVQSNIPGGILSEDGSSSEGTNSGGDSAHTGAATIELGSVPIRGGSDSQSRSNPRSNSKRSNIGAGCAGKVTGKRDDSGVLPEGVRAGTSKAAGAAIGGGVLPLVNEGVRTLDNGRDSGSYDAAPRTPVHGGGGASANSRRGGSSWNSHINRGWCEELGFFYRSWWERNYGFYLQWLKNQGIISKWEYEPQTFWFEKIRRGTNSYKPDFRITYPDGRVEYHEVKGNMTQRSATALKRMAMYYPDVTIKLIDKKSYKAIKSKSKMIPGWRTHATHNTTGGISSVLMQAISEKARTQQEALHKP